MSVLTDRLAAEQFFLLLARNGRTTPDIHPETISALEAAAGLARRHGMARAIESMLSAYATAVGTLGDLDPSIVEASAATLEKLAAALRKTNLEITLGRAVTTGAIAVFADEAGNGGRA